ncbi:MAG: YceI family protein [Pseudomonadota bacterium]
MRWLILFLLLPFTALAEPVAYTLDRERSLVGFAFDVGNDEIKGNMSVSSADIVLDLDNLARSTARVTLDTTSAVTEDSFATGAMRGAQVLDTSTFPTITFEATKISGTFNNGRVEGLVTIKGVTRPITLSAQVFRQRGQDAGDNSKLSVLLSGTVDRRDFGADGFAQFVGPDIRLDVLTRISRTGS